MARRKKALNLIGLVLIIVLAVAAALVWVPRLSGGSVYYVRTDSMEPTIGKGSMAYVTPVKLEEIRAGEDVLVFVDPLHGKSFMHRCVGVNPTSEMLFTKGDANSVADPLPTEYSSCVGRVTAHIPLLGYAAMALDTLAGKIFIVVFYAAFIAVSMEKKKTKAKRTEVEK